MFNGIDFRDGYTCYKITDRYESIIGTNSQFIEPVDTSIFMWKANSYIQFFINIFRAILSDLNHW